MTVGELIRILKDYPRGATVCLGLMVGDEEFDDAKQELDTSMALTALPERREGLIYTYDNGRGLQINAWYA